MRPSTLSKWALPASLTLLAVVLSPSVTATEADTARQVSEVSQFAGSPPERCVFASDGVELCTWSLEGRLIGREAQPATMALNLICEVATESQRGAPRCEVHPVGQLRSTLPPVGAAVPQLEDLRVLEQIEALPTSTDISWALGAIPATCRSASGAQRCDWTLPAEGRGGRLAVLRCELPLDGTPRHAGSCQIVERASDAS